MTLLSGKAIASLLQSGCFFFRDSKESDAGAVFFRRLCIEDGVSWGRFVVLNKNRGFWKWAL